jgi:signal transduction histidine kinase
VLATLYAATSLALMWRRRAPLTVLAFITGADLAYYLAYGAPEGLGSLLPALVAWYAVGRHLPVRSGVPGGMLVLLGLVGHELTDPIFGLNGLELLLWLVVAGAWVVGQAFQRRAREADQLVESREETARLAVAEERTRIARELHDVVGHGLSVAVLQLVAAAGFLDQAQPDAARDRIGTAERSAREALAEMRRLLDLLDEDTRASLTPQPGLEQVHRLLDDTRAAGATLDLAVRGERVVLPAGLDLAAYRVLQEALTNVLKHADPPAADVVITYGRDSLDLEVRDHGNGPSRRAAVAGGGRGLAGMRERVRLYDGDLQVGPAGDGGYVVHARFPVVTA